MSSGSRTDWLAVGAGAIRLASGVSFLIAPNAATRLWGDDEETTPTTQLLLRSMGYRDALIGGLLLRSGLEGGDKAAPWLLASAGADAADLLGGIGHHATMDRQQKLRGLGGAALGIGIGVLGAARARRRAG
ncbi:hypothetical protein BH10ACT3_BH10ACT3_15100 [soil metagenome]